MRAASSMSRSSPADRVTGTCRYRLGSTLTSRLWTSAGTSTMTGPCRPFLTCAKARRITFAICSGRITSSTDLVIAA